MGYGARRIKARVDARSQAEQVVGVIDVPGEFALEWLEVFNAAIREKVLGDRQETKQPEKTKWTYRQLAATVVTFGQYKGLTLEDCPPEYLDWLCREQEGFYERLRAFLKHEERPTEN